MRVYLDDKVHAQADTAKAPAASTSPKQSISSTMQSSTTSSVPCPKVPFGRPMRALFPFSPSYNPLNHGSYGAHPTAVGLANAAVRAEAESAPDPFIVFNFAPRLVEQRRLAADMLRCPLDELVFVPNATTGTDTVLKNIRWEKGDVIVCYDVVYGSLANGLSWVKEVHDGIVDVHVLNVTWPVGDDELVSKYVAAVREINNNQPGKRVRLAICDTIVSMPGMRIPFEKLVPALRAEGALVMLDGAHGIGHIDIDLSVVRPDFFVTNLHKWLFVPRSCAAFVVRKELQGMIRTTLPTSHGFHPLKPLEQGTAEDEDAYTDMFAFTGTADTTNWLTVDAAIKFRNETCGGEEVIQAYTSSVAQRAAVMAAEAFGTDILDHPKSCMRDCNFANVRLPLDYSKFDDPAKVVMWMKKTAVDESGVYFQLVGFQGAFYWRVSGMIYLEEDDYRKGIEVLQKLCERVVKREYLN